MKLLKSINPKQIFRLKKSRSVSKSAPASFGSASYSSSSSSSDSFNGGAATKTGRSSTLPARTRSDEWSDGETAIETFRFDYVQAFKMIDRNGDGKITVTELEPIIRRLCGQTANVTEEEVAAMIGEIDRDGDGCISLDELQTVGSVFESTVSGEEELRETFEIFDVDHDGKITAEELHSVFVALGDERCTLADCKRMIASVDKNGDGFVCFEDFTRMMDLQR